MMIYKDITKTVGNTPLVKINALSKDLHANIYAKLESFNPLSSVKDRVGLALIERAEKEGKINSNTLIIEPTSGNTGIALAFVCAARGYNLILAMPDTMSVERRKLLISLGAKLILTEGAKGMQGAIEKAEEIVSQSDNAFMPQQFKNKANPEIHKKTTAVEIWDALDGKIDYFVSGVGTGGTLTGVGEFLKEKRSDIQIVAVEPIDSSVLSGKPSGPHKIQGIGAGFIPEVLNRELIDEIVPVESMDAGIMARKLAQKEGILAGISSGAAFWASVEIAKREESKDKNIIVVFPDSGERYLSTWLFNEDN